jgi:hypothetical protein
MDETIAELYRKLGEHLGKTYGAKGAATTNAKLTTAQRKRAGKKAAAKLTPEQRKERARQAARTRWAAEKETAE